MRPRKPNADETEKDRNFVTALSRGLELMRCFRKGDQGLGNGDFAKRTGLSKSTISRLTYTLHKDGYLTYDPETARYRLAPPVLSLGFSCLSGIWPPLYWRCWCRVFLPPLTQKNRPLAICRLRCIPYLVCGG